MVVRNMAHLPFLNFFSLPNVYVKPHVYDTECRLGSSLVSLVPGVQILQPVSLNRGRSEPSLSRLLSSQTTCSLGSHDTILTKGLLGP